MNIRNQEHYMDTTAFHAIRNAENRTGEVWHADFNGILRHILVLADHDNITTILTLEDVGSINNPHEVECAWGKMYTNTKRLGHLIDSRFVSRACKLDTEDFENILQDVADDLGIKPVEKMVEVEKIVEVEVEKVVEAEKPLKTRTVALQKDLMKAQAEADVYKTLYTEMLQRLIGGAVSE